MKFKKRITAAIVAVIFIPVLFCVLLAFSGIFDSLVHERVLKKTVGKFYEAMRTETLDDFDFEKEVKLLIKADIIMYNNDNLIVFSSIPELKAGVQISDSFIKDISKVMVKKALVLTSISEIEKSNAHLLEKLPGYGKYDLNCAIFWESSTFLDLHPQVRIIITIFLFILLIFGLVISVGTLLLLAKSRRQLSRVSEKYASGDYSREIPENGSDDDNSIIAVLNQMRSRILTDEKQKAHIIMGLSHDFKTPLTLIRAYAELIDKQNKEGDELIAKGTKIINEKVIALESMVNEVTDYAALAQDDYPVNLKEVNFTDWLLTYVKQSENDASLSRKKLIADIKTPFDMKLKIDEKLLGRAMDNILHNALRYAAEDGSVKIFSRLYDNDFIEFGIEDDGQGIDKKDKPFIFDMFYRADPARKEGHMGIGLAVVKDIIETHGWNIEVRDAKPHGSVFLITARRV